MPQCGFVPALSLRTSTVAKNTLTQDNPTIPQVVRALRESMADGSMEPTSRSLVIAACKERGVPIKDGRIVRYQRNMGDVYFGVRKLIERGGVRVGQRWASRDKRDIQRGHNQRREVTSIMFEKAFLDSDSPAFDGSFGVAIKNGAVDRHRLVEDVA